MQEPTSKATASRSRPGSALRSVAGYLPRVLSAFRHRVLGRHAEALRLLQADHQAALQRIQTLEAALDEQSRHLQRIEAVESGLGEHDRQLQVRNFMDWIAHATVPEATRISIVLPTRDRCTLLQRAIASVMDQAYANWELVVVDDASVDDTREYLAQMEDTRVRSYRADGRGVCAARNAGLAQVRGHVVAYLDDDNIMHPNWLKSVAWGFTQRPQASVLYGGFLVDDPARINPREGGELPRLYFWPYDHHHVAIANIADISCIAHRAGLPEARFDESLREMGDWDLFLRLTREAPPLALPAIACFYTTDAPNRLSYGPTYEADQVTVRAKNRR